MEGQRPPPEGDNNSRHKVLFVGPTEAGKSTIANVLAENAEAATDNYRPTVGVRILEFEGEVQRFKKNVTIELWDVSGDQKYNKCWPAIRKDAVGCVLVYNPEKSSHEEDVEQWFTRFPKTMNMNPNQVMVIQALQRADTRKYPLPNRIAFQNVGPPTVVTADDLVSVRGQFDKFLERVSQCVLDRQQKEEEDVMQNQGQ